MEWPWPALRMRLLRASVNVLRDTSPINLAKTHLKEPEHLFFQQNPVVSGTVYPNNEQPASATTADADKPARAGRRRRHRVTNCLPLATLSLTLCVFVCARSLEGPDPWTLKPGWSRFVLRAALNSLSLAQNV